jgi:hypothetical protein
MERGSREWLVPLTGVAFIVLAIVSFAIMGEPKDAEEPVNEIVDYYVDNKDAIQIASFFGAAASVLLLVYGAYLRKVLQAAAPEGDILPLLSLIGLVIMVVGFAIDSTILFATAEAAEDIEPTSVQTLQALWDNDFIPIATGILVFLWSTGISVVRSGALPRWLGWVAILFGIVALTPIGFAAFVGTALWVVVTSILLSLRARSAPAAAAPPAA